VSARTVVVNVPSSVVYPESAPPNGAVWWIKDGWYFDCLDGTCTCPSCRDDRIDLTNLGQALAEVGERAVFDLAACALGLSTRSFADLADSARRYCDACEDASGAITEAAEATAAVAWEGWTDGDLRAEHTKRLARYDAAHRAWEDAQRVLDAQEDMVSSLHGEVMQVRREQDRRGRR
jgi:hypothetical protein